MPASRSGERGSASASAARRRPGQRGHDRRPQLQPVPDQRRDDADRHRAPREPAEDAGGTHERRQHSPQDRLHRTRSRLGSPRNALRMTPLRSRSSLPDPDWPRVGRDRGRPGAGRVVHGHRRRRGCARRPRPAQQRRRRLRADGPRRRPRRPASHSDIRLRRADSPPAQAASRIQAGPTRAPRSPRARQASPAGGRAGGHRAAETGRLDAGHGRLAAVHRAGARGDRRGPGSACWLRGAAPRPRPARR